MIDQDPRTLTPSERARRAADERRIGRLLIILTYVSVALLVMGLIVMVGRGVSPLDGAPRMDLAGLLEALRSWRPEGLIWLGILAVMATPILRVIAAALTFARGGEWRMVGIAVAVLVVIAVGVVTALVTSS